MSAPRAALDLWQRLCARGALVTGIAVTTAVWLVGLTALALVVVSLPLAAAVGAKPARRRFIAVRRREGAHAGRHRAMQAWTATQPFPAPQRKRVVLGAARDLNRAGSVARSRR